MDLVPLGKPLQTNTKTTYVHSMQHKTSIGKNYAIMTTRKEHRIEMHFHQL